MQPTTEEEKGSEVHGPQQRSSASTEDISGPLFLTPKSQGVAGCFKLLCFWSGDLNKNTTIVSSSLSMLFSISWSIFQPQFCALQIMSTIKNNI